MVETFANSTLQSDNKTRQVASETKQTAIVHVRLVGENGLIPNDNLIQDKSLSVEEDGASRHSMRQ